MSIENIDRELHQLALIAQSHPKRSPQRRSALAKICKILNQPGILQVPGQEDAVWQEAKQNFFLYLCRTMIDNYSPERGDPDAGGSFIRWSRVTLKYRHRDVLRARSSETKKTISLDGIGRNREVKGSWEDFINKDVFNNHDSDSISQKLRRFIEDDPDGKFKSAHISNKPDANFQVLALRVYTGEPFKDLSKRLGVPVPTLSSYFQRKLAHFKSYIQDYLMND